MGRWIWVFLGAGACIERPGVNQNPYSTRTFYTGYSTYGSSTTGSPPALVEQYSVSCDADVATFEAGLSAPGIVNVYVQETAADGAGRAEEHPLSPESSHPSVTLAAAAETALPGVATTFTCAELEADDRLAYAFFLLDPRSGAATDCLAGGHDVQAFVAGDYAGDDAALRADLAICVIGV